MELYLDLLSQPCRSVFLFAKVAGIDFEFKHVDLAAGNPTSTSQTRRENILVFVQVLGFI